MEWGIRWFYLRSVDVAEERVTENDVEALEAVRVEREVLVGVDACGDVRVLAVNGQSRDNRESQVQRVNGELLATVEYE